MTETTKKWFYGAYVVLILLIIAENIWFGKGHLLRYNMIAFWTIVLCLIILGGDFPSRKDGLSFYIFVLIILIIHGALLLVIHNYFVLHGL